jgi:hypothetical protein
VGRPPRAGRRLGPDRRDVALVSLPCNRARADCVNKKTASTPTSPTVRKAARPGNVKSTGITPANAQDS